MKKEKGYLVLENGCVFKGERFGAPGEAIGEGVFTTGMTGYLETLTDPSYFEQIVMQTFPIIGNYGVIPPDFESGRIRLKAYIVREWCQEPSNFRSEGAIDAFLKQQSVVGLSGVDTRAITRVIREKGVMNAVVCGEDPVPRMEELLEKLHGFTPLRAIPAVSVPEKIRHGEGRHGRKVALMDFGCKRSLIRALLQRDCEVTAFPWNTSAEEIAAYAPDGIVLSNGPGDPGDNMDVVAEVKKLLERRIPIFGICLGHQLLALACGASTEKLKYGHRGANQPVKDLKGGRVFITSQNHGYTVVNGTLPVDMGEVSHINANDGTCEGIRYSRFPVFSVQFHPEAAAGPLDTRGLFDDFLAMMEGGAVCR